MKKFTLLITICVLLLGFAGCDDKMEKMNTDPLALSSLPSEYLFTTAIRQIVGDNFTYLNSFELRFASQYAHIYVTNSEFRPADLYMDAFTQDIYKEMFNTAYVSTLRYINKVVEMTSKGDSKNPVRNAIARIAETVEYARVTDCWGDVPYFDGASGLEGVLYPAYDDQESIYHDMMNQLKNAVDTLKNADASLGFVNADPVYNNDLTKWICFANSMRLRLAMRARFVDPVNSAEVITECMSEPFIETNDYNFGLQNVQSENADLYNPWYECRLHQNFKMSNMFVESLKSTSDPRLEILVDTTSTGEYMGFINGINDVKAAEFTWNNFSNPKPSLYSKSQPVYAMCASEVWFLRAEAALFNLAPGDADELYKKGIRSNMELWNVATADIDNFLSNENEATLNGNDENKFRQIATQMWIAFVPDFTEAWSNIRRTGYPVIPQRTDATIYALGITNGILPKRFEYSSSEYLTNGANLNNAIVRQGADLIGTPVWWDVRGK
jgi:hypothetical protein